MSDQKQVIGEIKCLCKKCKKPTEVFGSSWCSSCWYPSIDEVYQDYQNMLAEGFRREDAAVRSGWLGAEEI